MKRFLKFFSLILVFITIFSIKINITYADSSSDKIFLGGMPAGITIDEKGAYIIGFSDVVTNQGAICPAKESGLKVGDIILKIDENEVNNADDVEHAINDGGLKIIEYKRDGQSNIAMIMPVKDMTNHFRLGIFIKDDINGIGTITYIKNDRFASLGHPILSNNGDIIEINGGKAYNCNIIGCVRGERGCPGELKGVFLKNKPIAEIENNLESGLYGNITENFDKNSLIEIELGEGKPGNASIFTTINGESPTEYSISIIKADSPQKENKNFIIKITDERLLDSTGGIVQGMSGSPIVQDGKLVGAVTHVFVNDPTRGFGISIENMINN